VSRTERLWVVLVANLALVGALIAVGIAAHSLGVWAEGADYLADAAAIGVSILAIHLARRPPTPRRPHGYPRATRYAARINAGWLLVLSVLIIASAIGRLAGGMHRVHGLPVLIVSAIAAGVMLAGALLLGGDIDDDDQEEGEDLNLRAVLLDTAADAAAAAGVAAAGAVIYTSHGLYWLDPAVALTIAAVVAYHATRLLLQIRTALTR
jgi:cobalt-zinc-cadmium efflux system protein